MQTTTIMCNPSANPDAEYLPNRYSKIFIAAV